VKVNSNLVSFFNDNYGLGRVCLVGASDVIGWLIRNGQAGLTPDNKASLWSHTFLMGERRHDGRNDGSIYIYESDLHVSTVDWQVINGAQENRIVKWCRDDIEHACVLGTDLSPQEALSVSTKGLELAYDEHHLRYPVGELFGTLWAIITRSLQKKNIFDEKYAVQCATLARMCYQSIGRDILTGAIDLTHTSPEKIYQSQVFTFRKEWHKQPRIAQEDHGELIRKKDS
jgi:hypothetical protein